MRPTAVAIMERALMYLQGAAGLAGGGWGEGDAGGGRSEGRGGGREFRMSEW